MQRGRLSLRAIPCAIGTVMLGAHAADAQSDGTASTPASLPRPGYERPAPMRLGTMALRLDFDLSALYDSNVYATHTGERDDGVIRAAARATISNDRADRLVEGQAHVERNQHIDITRENTTTFGGLLRGHIASAGNQTLDGTIRYDRAIESRADPETRAGISPGKIDIAAAEGSYGYQGPRLGAVLSLAAQSYDYRDPKESDRDLRSYQASLRLLHQLDGPLSLFVEPYVVRRDFRAAVDLSGVNRDATTVGALLGLSHSDTPLLRGRVGFGLFRFMPDSPLLRPFTGFAANGQITWSPRRRTSLTATIFSGDVATVTAGAVGRHDTSLALRIDQEAHHNLLLDGQISWEQNRYRGAPSANRDTLRLQGGATYLITRLVALYAEASVTSRSATREDHRFERHTFSIGIQFQR